MPLSSPPDQPPDPAHDACAEAAARMPPRWGLGLMLSAPDAQVGDLIAALDAHAIPASSVQLDPAQDPEALAHLARCGLRAIAPLDAPQIAAPLRGGGASCPGDLEGMRLLRVAPDLGPLPDSRDALTGALQGALELARAGEDLVGFAALAQPCDDPELLLRRLEIALFLPRPVLPGLPAPWLDSTLTAAVRRLIVQRYRLMPALYAALWQARLDGVPFLSGRPEAYLLGADLLVVPALDTVPMALPDSRGGWYETDTGQWFAPGQAVARDRLRIYVRAGHCLAQVLGLHRNTGPGGPRNQCGALTLTLYPPPGAFDTQVTQLFSDDGETARGPKSCVTLRLRGDDERLDLDWDVSGDLAPPAPQARVRLPVGETRTIWFRDMPAISGGLADFDPTPALPVLPVDD
jgi:hypothetical protein